MDLVEAGARGFAAASRHPWERARARLAHRLLARYVPLRPGASVLDVGCGDTFVAEQLALAHPDVRFVAVDSAFTGELLAALRQSLVAPNVTLGTTLGEVSLEAPAACILLMDVLEHVEDDRALLAELCRGPLVGRDTRVLITVPSYQSLFCSHDRFLRHYRRYSRGQLRRLLAASGLAPIVDGYLFSSLLPLRAFQALRERLLGEPAAPTTDVASWRGGESLARPLARVLEAEGRVELALAGRGVVVPGLSTFAICRISA